MMLSALMMVVISLKANYSSTVGTSTGNITHESSHVESINLEVIPRFMTLDGIDGRGRNQRGFIDAVRRQYLLMGGPIPQIMNYKIDLSIFDN